MNSNENRAEPVSDRAPAALPWVIWGVGALFFSYGFFHRVTASVMVSDIMRDFGVTGAVLGNLSAFYFYAYAGLQVPVGVAVDRFGPRRVMTLAALLCAAGSLMFGLAPDIGIAYLGRLFIGAGAGFALIGTFKLGTIWFPPERFALITGLTATIGVLGAVVGQAPLGAAIAHFGWRSMMVAAAVFGVGIAAMIWTIARDRSPYRPAPAQPASTLAGVLGGVGSVFGTGHNWSFALILASMTVPLLAFAGLWGVPFLMEAYDLSRPAAAGTTSLFLIGHGVGSASFGWTSDRIRRRKPPIIVGTMATTALLAIVIYVPGLPYLALQGLLFFGGIASGASVVNFAFAREHNRAAVAATAMGFVNLLNISASAVFQPLLGWFLDLTWDGTLIDGARIYSASSFRTAFMAVIAIGIAGVIASLFVRETHCRPLFDSPNPHQP